MTTDRRGIRFAVVAVLLGLLATLVLYRIASTAEVTSEIRNAQVTNGRTLDNSSETLRIIRDCVNPRGACYLRGQKQTARVVAGLTAGTQQAAAAATSCAVALQEAGKPVTYRTVYRCIVRTTQALDHKR